MLRFVPIAIGLILAACSTATDDEPETGAEAVPAAEAASAALPAEIQQAKEANDKYRDVTVATAEGFMPDPTGMCVTAAEVGAPAELGGMGIHYAHLGRLGAELPAGEGPPPPGFRLSGDDATIDPDQPEVLVYEPQEDGSLELVALEYMVFQDAWEAAGNTSPPTLTGQEFYLMADDPATEMDEAHGFEPHYELHAWTHRDNPTGVFSEWNPNVSCPPAEGHEGMTD